MPDTISPTERAANLREELFGNDLIVSEIAHILDLDESTVRRRLGDGTLDGYRLGREWRMTEEALRRYAVTLKGTTLSGTASPIMPHDWGSGSGSIKFMPSVTHPIGTSVTYTGGQERDEP